MCELCNYTPAEREDIVRDGIRIGNAVSKLNPKDAAEMSADLAGILYGKDTPTALLSAFFSFQGYYGLKFEELPLDNVSHFWDKGLEDLISSLSRSYKIHKFLEGH